MAAELWQYEKQYGRDPMGYAVATRVVPDVPLRGTLVPRHSIGGGDAFAEVMATRAPTVNESLGSTKVSPIYLHGGAPFPVPTQANGYIVRPSVRRTDNFYDEQGYLAR